MRVERRRAKKLIVAFHFHTTGGPSRWRCDECRRAGLTAQRRCGLEGQTNGADRVVWAHGNVGTTECPQSAITGESVAWLEMFAAWRCGWRVKAGMAARDVEAMLILNREWMAEASGGQ